MQSFSTWLGKIAVRTSVGLLGSSAIFLCVVPFAAATPTTELFEQLNQYDNQNSQSQVTNVNQLRDVSPGDWAYEALANLVNRYGCIVGYPNQTYRGNQALTRYEFAAGLNSCLNVIERLIAQGGGGVSPEDLETIQRLVSEFEAELATLGARVDDLEGRTALLEDNQFSTTTTLNGEVIFGLASIFAGEQDTIFNIPNDQEEVEQNTFFGDRVRLELNTSFTGEDLLFTRLSATNLNTLVDDVGTFEGGLSFSGDPADVLGESGGNDVGLEVLYYAFNLGEQTEVIVGATGLAADDIANTVNPLDGDGGSGAISLFGTRNSIYYLPDGAGVGIIHRLNDKIELSAGYFAGDANDPSEGSGLFDGAYSALGQVLFQPTENIDLALTYIQGYNQSDFGTGMRLANVRFLSEQILGQTIPTSSNSYGVEAAWRVNDNFIVSGWAGYTNVRLLEDIPAVLNGVRVGEITSGDLNIWNWAVALAFPDLGREGSLGGIIVGMEPWVDDFDVEVPDLLDTERNDSFHIEAFYEYRINDNIAITPGVILITAPDFDDENENLVIGTIRTTFTF